MADLIPKVIHVVYHPDKISSAQRGHIEKIRVLHPGWELMEWAEPHNPDQFSLSPRWKFCTSPEQLSDLVRVDVVSKYGGIYVDLDFEVVQELSGLLKFEFFVGTEDGHGLSNALFGSKPGGAAIEKLRTEMARLAPDDFSGEADQLTGSGCFVRHLRYRDDVTVLPRDVLYPDIDMRAAPAGGRPRALAVRHGRRVSATTTPLPHRLHELRRSAKRALIGARHALQRALSRRPETYSTAAPLVVRTVHGQFLHVSGEDLSITPHLVVDGSYELPEERFLGRWLRGGDWLIDVGANVGVMSILGGSHVGPMGRVLALEPNPVTRGHLERSVALNWFQDRVKILPLAAGETAGAMKLAFSRRFLGGGSLAHDRGSDEMSFTSRIEPEEFVDVDVVRLDDLLPSPLRARLLKIDVEGFEAFVLRGAEDLLHSGRVDAILLEASASVAGEHWPDFLEVLQSLLACTYSLYLIGRNGVPHPARLADVLLMPSRNCLLVHNGAPLTRASARN